MAYTTPSTRATGYTVTAANWNELVNDIISFRSDYCMLKRTVVQTIPDNSLTSILWDSEAWDVGGLHSLVGDTDKITIVRTGIYFVSSFIKFTAHAGNYDYCDFYLNETSVISEDKAGVAAVDNTFIFSTIVRLAATDYITIRVKQTSGGNLDIMRESDYSPRFSAIMLEDLT